MSGVHSSFFESLVPLWRGEAQLIGITLRPDIAMQIAALVEKEFKADALIIPAAEIQTHTCLRQVEPWLFFTDRHDLKRHVSADGHPEEIGRK